MKAKDSIGIKEYIRIKNIGPLKDVLIPDLKPFIVLTGASGSGKSTLMKVIVLMRYVYKREVVTHYLGNLRGAQNDDSLVTRFYGLFKDGLNELITSQSFIDYCVQINGLSYNFTFNGAVFCTMDNISSQDLVFFKEVWVSQMRSLIPALADNDSLGKDSYGSCDSSLGYYFDETLNDFVKVTNEINIVDLDFLDLRLEVLKSRQKGNTQKKFIIRPSDSDNSKPDGHLELKFASSGIQSTAILTSLLRYYSSEKYEPREHDKPSIELNHWPTLVHMYIEEPELGQDPRSQCLVANTMARYAFHELADNRKMGLILTTHSPYILNQLNVLLRAGYTDAGRDNYPYLEADSVSAYKLVDGRVINLMAIDEESNQLVINTMDFSEVMEDIYNEYDALS